jgi:hypothetical protein
MYIHHFLNNSRVIGSGTGHPQIIIRLYKSAKQKGYQSLLSLQPEKPAASSS